MNKKHKSYEDEQPLSYDDYAARQLSDQWVEKRKNTHQEKSRLSESFYEAFFWLVIAYAAIYLFLWWLAGLVE